MVETRSPANPLFLRDEELRQGIELMFYAYRDFTFESDQQLKHYQLGRAHHRALYFIARKPDLTVSELLSILAITKQSLGRVLGELSERGLVETRTGERDRRQRLLRLTPAGAALEGELFDALREKMATAYSSAGQGAVGGFWAVLEGLVPENEKARVSGSGR